MAMVGDALLSAAFETLLDKITSGEFKDFFKKGKLNHSLLDELETTLLALSAVLNDAEEKEISNPHVRKWLDKLEDAIMDAEDLLDEINYHSLRCKVEGDSQTSTNQVWKFLSSPFSQFYSEINSKMEGMCGRLKTFLDKKDILGLQSVSHRVSKRVPTTPLMNESVMVGRMDEKEKLRSVLLFDDHQISNNIDVVAILGMGGVRKTTLTQLLYNDEEVQEYFDLKAWACVSDDFDVIRVTKTLLESITSRVCDNNNLELLQTELKQTLGDKNFLLVLDDLWNEKYDDWDNLRIPFSSGKKGSKIIVTTRLEQVAKLSNPFHIHRLQPLSDDDCWCLLAKHAFGSEDSSRNPHLENIGRKIAYKCGGLPIAAKTLGGLLCSKLDAKEWDKVLNSNLWDLQSDGILPALRLSYLYLPAHLKRCFAYCSIFPKDYLLDRKNLILLWMAEGLVGGSHEEEKIEELGENYFSELLSRSLIQPFKDANVNKFVMHDLVNDLAAIVSKKNYFWCDGIEISKNIRRLSYKQNQYDDWKKFENIHSLKCLRSILPLGFTEENCLSEKVLNNLFLTYKFLRGLTLSRYVNITELPNSIKDLVHLRYLDLSYTRIKRLPDTVCTLYNLQTLKLLECGLLDELPTHIGKLINLRHLDVRGCKLKVMPLQIGRLQNLRTLTHFIVGKQRDAAGVRELANIPHLQGKLSILKLQNAKDATEAADVNLKSKHKIEELMLEWDDTEDSKIEREVLCHLQPSTDLRKLTIRGYCGTSFPTWLGDSSFCNMVSLCISRCYYCIALPPFGQLPSLRELCVVGMKFLESLGPEFYGQSFEPFPSLEHLEFRNMENWEEWLPLATEGSKVPFPRLKSLHLDNCPKLRQHLPHHLPSLSRVSINRCCELKTTSTLHWLTSIETLHINGVGQWPLLGDEHDSGCSLENLSITDCGSLPSLPRMIMGSICLGSLSLDDIPSLTCFPIGGLPTSLRSLEIRKCPNLAFLPPETWCNYTSLATLRIDSSCDSLRFFPLDSFPALEDLQFYSVGNLESLSISEASVNHPSRLSWLCITYCENLRSLSGSIHRFTNLRQLLIVGLPELASLAQAGLPPNLQRLRLRGCGRLSPAGIADWGLQHLTSLSHLEIGGDDIVNALLEEPLLLPNSLVSLRICHLSNLKSLKGNEFQHFTSLQRLEFIYCERLEFIPEDGLQRFISLEELSISQCPMLQSLPEQGIRNLTNLKQLSISGCPMLQSLPEQGIQNLTNLEELCITGCPMLQSLPEQGIRNLTNLKQLSISGCPLLQSLPEQGIRNLNNLKRLSIGSCPMLQSLPEQGIRHLTNLGYLTISDCPRLESLPEQGLPAFLFRLSIWNCPLLEARYQSPKGKHWSKIAHIPIVYFPV